MLYGKASKSFLKKNVETLLSTKSGRAYSTLKMLGARPGDDLDSANFSLPDFKGSDKTSNEIADEIADFFAQISQKFQPMDVARLPVDVRTAIEVASRDQVPVITPDTVEIMILKVNVNKGQTKGDVPPKLYKAAIKKLKTPIVSIFNNVAKTGVWQSRWKIENSYPLRKIPSPLSLNDIRVISKNPFLCTQFEKIVL